MAAEEPPLDRCEVEVTGMPMSVIPHHRLAIGAKDVRTLEARMELSVGADAARLEVIGPRYWGVRQLRPGECRDGAVLNLSVHPLPAHVEFPCAPSGLTVTCASCPGASGQGVHLASKFPVIPMKSFSLEVEVLLRAPGFRRKTQRLMLHPGPNRVHIELEPLGR